jgi:hypothetical protein
MKISMTEAIWTLKGSSEMMRDQLALNLFKREAVAHFEEDIESNTILISL